MSGSTKSILPGRRIELAQQSDAQAFIARPSAHWYDLDHSGWRCAPRSETPIRQLPLPLVLHVRWPASGRHEPIRSRLKGYRNIFATIIANSLHTGDAADVEHQRQKQRQAEHAMSVDLSQTLDLHQRIRSELDQREAATKEKAAEARRAFDAALRDIAAELDAAKQYRELLAQAEILYRGFLGTNHGDGSTTVVQPTQTPVAVTIPDASLGTSRHNRKRGTTARGNRKRCPRARVTRQRQRSTGSLVARGQSPQPDSRLGA